nr:heme-binding protein 2-like [Lytechinus pictus]
MAKFLRAVLMLVSSAQLSLSATVVAQQARALSTESKPGFCRGLECPEFTTVHSAEGYDERQYSESKWVSTEIMSMDYESATSQGFERLFNYITTIDQQKQKVAMTAPVATRVIPGQGPACESNFTVSFFIPAQHSANPPIPSDSDVFFSTIPAHRAYVKSFGGFASQNDWIQAGTELGQALEAASKSYDSSYFYTAGYDSPFTIFNRHNEVWFTAN